MIKFYCLIFILVVTSDSTNAQNYLEINDNDSTETIEEHTQLIIDFMSTINFDNCADIGSGNLELILKIANAYFDKKFTLEDIDASSCNRANMNSQISRLNLTNIDTNLISIQIGDVESTGLPDNQFDLILMSGLIHEINDNSAFFADIRRILKPSGTIILSDAFYELPPNPHQGCTNRFLTNKEMEQLITNQNLTVLKDWRRIGIKTRSNGPYISRIIQCSFN
jgi:ubiquinone/menaquinone biosynthesis C-methylase UbiE